MGFDGSNYLVAWADGQRAAVDQGRACRATGTLVLDPGGFIIFSVDKFDWATQPESVAFDGTNYLAVFHRQLDIIGHEWVWERHVSPDGVVLEDGAWLDFGPLDDPAVAAGRTQPPSSPGQTGRTAGSTRGT